MSFAAAIGAAGGLASGLIGSNSVKETNAANIKLAREQMRFQEKMSNSAYQRATTDLSKAGLNRILALGSPATTPAGAKATLQAPGLAMAEGIRAGTNSALQARVQDAQIEQLEGQAGVAIKTARNLDTTQSLIQQQITESASRTDVNSAQYQALQFQNQVNSEMGPFLRILQQLGGPTAALAGAGLTGVGGLLLGRGKRRGAPKIAPRATIKPGAKATNKNVPEPMKPSVRKEITDREAQHAQQAIDRVNLILRGQPK